MNLERDELKRLGHYFSYVLIATIILLMILLPIPYTPGVISDVFGERTDLIIFYEFFMLSILGHSIILNRHTYQTTIRDLKNVISKLEKGQEFTSHVANTFRENISVVEKIAKEERKEKEAEMLKKLKTIKEDNAGTLNKESKTIMERLEALENENRELRKKAEKYEELEKELENE